MRSTTNVDFVRSIGADRVIDYAQDDFTRDGKEFDLLTHRKKANEAEVRRHVKTCVDEFCGRLNRVETIKDFRILDHNRRVEAGGLMLRSCTTAASAPTRSPGWADATLPLVAIVRSEPAAT